WQALGPGGVHDEINMADDVYAIAIDAAGNVYVGGTFTYAGGVLANNIAMWDGSRWSSLASGSNDKVYALAVAGGSLYAAGAFTQIGAISANHIAKWNPGTKAWSALGSGINNTVYTLAYADGLLYAGGNFTAAGSALANDVAYWDGAQWHAFGDTFQIYQVNQRGAENDTTVYALAIAGSDVYVGGQFWTLQDRASSGYVEVNNIVVWDRSSDEWSFVGTPTATVKAGVVDTESAYAATVNALALSGDQLYVGGIFNQAGSLATSGLARWNIAGNTWADVGGVGGFSYPYLSEVKALTPFGGYLYVGGKFTSAGTASARFVARMDLASGAWSALGSGIGDTHGYDEYTYVYSIAASGEGIYLGGNFSSVATQPSYGLARWGAPGVSGSMGAAGGTLSGVDGTSLTFPAGAVPNSITVSYTALFAPAHQPPAGQAIIRSFTLRATGADGGPVTTFAKPYTLRVPYTDAQLAALGISDPTKLNVAYWGGSAWANMLPCAGCRVDTAGKAVVVVANHFSEFALAGSRTYVYLPLVRR
ncbi:hypothetical protein K2Z83_08810, partial [Oscillochloris sp. ZM17-4]|nr:hypothetical protein [Oscillochloris sp. ZM17-4]